MAWNMSDSSGRDQNLSNRRKHGVSFEEACQVFLDPLYVSVQDRIEGGESRWQTLGLVEGVLLLTWPTPSGKNSRTAPWSTSFASSPLDARPGKRDDAMKTRMVSYTLDKLPRSRKRGGRN